MLAVLVDLTLAVSAISMLVVAVFRMDRWAGAASAEPMTAGTFRPVDVRGPGGASIPVSIGDRAPEMPGLRDESVA